MRLRSLILLTLALVSAHSGCATVRPEIASPPPPVPVVAPLAAEVAVTVRGNPDVAVFRSVFERTLGRAGFRVLPDPNGAAISLSLIGNGAATSGANEAGSSVHQSLSMAMTVSRDGRLVSEHHSDVRYVASYDRENTNDSFERFNQRVGDYHSRAFEWLAADLTNQLIATLAAHK